MTRGPEGMLVGAAVAIPLTFLLFVWPGRVPAATVFPLTFGVGLLCMAAGAFIGSRIRWRP